MSWRSENTWRRLLWPLSIPALGDKDSAIEWLEKAYEERSSIAIIFSPKVFPAFDSLRSDPRLQALLRRAGL